MNTKNSEIIANATDFIIKAADQYNYHSEVVTKCNKLVCDIEHELELGDYNRDGLAKLAREIRDAKRERRKSKDIVEELQPIMDFMGEAQNRKLISNLQELVGAMRKVEKYHEHRFYTPKVRGNKND